MTVLSGIVDNYKVEILYKSDNKPCHLLVKYISPDVTTIDDVFPNALMLSANLRDAVGLANARILLSDWKIPISSTLWDLNHER